MVRGVFIVTEGLAAAMAGGIVFLGESRDWSAAQLVMGSGRGAHDFLRH